TSPSVAAPAFCEAAVPADRSAAAALAPSSLDAGTWARHALEGGPWGVAALRHLFDDALLGRSATEAAVMQTFTAQIGFANLEFFAAAARSSGDLDDDLATAIAAAEAAEVRQAQQGAATLRVLVENGRAAEAQQLVDVAFWRAWRVLCLTTGQAMDYHVPLAHRTRSFKELVVATIVEPFARALTGLGLETPWYWDQFRRSVDSYQHGMHLGIWCWRPHGGFPARPGVAADERQWLEEKYPGWNDSFGRCWDAIAENTRLGKLDRGRAASVPVVCSLCCIPIVGVPGAGWSGAAGTRAYGLTHEGRCYSFCSEACRWIFRLDPKRYAGHLGFIDRTVRRLTTAGAGQAASFLDRRSNDSQPQG
ncbi:MAG TPA: YHS domain-containing protein, partial [Polyangia bacterium]